MAVEGSKRLTLRFKEGTNKKTGKQYGVLQRYVKLPFTNKSILIQISCDLDGNIKTYYSSKANDRPYVYCTIKIVTSDRHMSNSGQSWGNPSNSGWRR